ncbi:hypothetical protein M569_16346, partial [Genlisea aurea]
MFIHQVEKQRILQSSTLSKSKDMNSKESNAVGAAVSSSAETKGKKTQLPATKSVFSDSSSSSSAATKSTKKSSGSLTDFFHSSRRDDRPDACPDVETKKKNKKKNSSPSSSFPFIFKFNE